MTDGEDLVEVVHDDPDGAIWEPAIGPVALKLRDYFVSSNRDWTVDGADRVVSEACTVLSQCSPPNGHAPRRCGLVCGYVQSGKTASMTAVSALAKDNGYRVIILIAGTTTILVNQNRDRMETHLREAAPEWTWLMLTNPRAPNDQPAVEALLEEWRSEVYDESDRRTLFVSVMKHHTHLQNLADLLGRVDLSDVPAIIFDDEADQASLNTRPSDPTASSTYRTIDAIRQVLPRHTYLQYTATPQAPLLITRIDSLSADFAELLSEGTGYVGGRDFFSGQSPYVEPIPPSEVFQDGQLPTVPPASLMRAMQTFLVGVAAGRLGTVGGHRSMLVHPSKATATHRRYYDWTNSLKSHWHRVLLEGFDADKADLLEDFKRAYDDLARTCPGIPPFDRVRAKLPVAINQTAVTLVNSVDGSEVPWDNGYSHILVGGEKLSRGYTIKGLTVTYMPRSPGGWTADTIQQRARFFGYHSKYLGYCRIYLHRGVRSAYVAYVSHEEDMRARLAEQRGRPLQEWRRLFYLDRRLAPTRRNVLSSPYLRPQFADGWFAPRAPQVSPFEGHQNLELERQLERLEFLPHDRYPQHQWAIANLQDIFEQFLVPLSYLDDDDALGLCVVNCNVGTLLDRKPDARCLVYLMDRGRLRLRRLSGGRIPQLFQGRSSAGSQSYPGDRAFMEEDITTVQVHMLRVESGSAALDDVPAVAVRLTEQEDIVVHDEQ